MCLGSTTFVLNSSAEPDCLRPSSLINPGVRTECEFWGLRVVSAMVDLSVGKPFTACRSLVGVEPAPHLPKYSSPRNSVFTDVTEELINVPVLVGDVLG